MLFSTHKIGDFLPDKFGVGDFVDATIKYIIFPIGEERCPLLVTIDLVLIECTGIG